MCLERIFETINVCQIIIYLESFREGNAKTVNNTQIHRPKVSCEWEIPMM